MNDYDHNKLTYQSYDQILGLGSWPDVPNGISMAYKYFFSTIFSKIKFLFLGGNRT